MKSKKKFKLIFKTSNKINKNLLINTSIDKYINKCNKCIQNKMNTIEG